MPREELNRIISSAQGALGLARVMGNNTLQSKALENLLRVVTEMTKPLPDGLITREQAMTWMEGKNEGLLAHNIPTMCKTILELYDRIGHDENTTEETQDIG